MALRRHVPAPHVGRAGRRHRAGGRRTGMVRHGRGWGAYRSAAGQCLPAPPTLFRKARGAFVAVTTPDGRHLLGSPIDVAAIAATTGCVTALDGGLTGWAWHPGDPDLDPVLTIRPARGSRQDHRSRRPTPRRDRRQQRPCWPGHAASRWRRRSCKACADRCMCLAATARTCSAARWIPRRIERGADPGRVRDAPDERARVAAAATRPTWWCRYTAAPTTRWPASPAYSPLCRARAG